MLSRASLRLRIATAAALVPVAACLGLAAPAGADPGSWVQLASGTGGSYLWSVRVSSREGPRGAESSGARRLCLLAATAWRTTPLEYHRSSYRECVPAAAPHRLGPPLLATSSQPSTGGRARISAVGMVFAPAARRVRMVLAGGRVESLPLRLLRPGRGEAAVGRLRYAAFEIGGAWCAERLTSIAADGTALWDSGTDEYRCGAAGTRFAVGG